MLNVRETTMDDATIFASVPVPTEGTMMREETFGGMLAGGNMPLLSLNPDAVAIWQIIDGKRTVEEMATILETTHASSDVRKNLPAFIRYCLHGGSLGLRS
jgi:hypothetical protein